MVSKRFLPVMCAVVLPFASWVALRAAPPAQQQESVADAARKAQAAKKQSSKSPMVVTNDNLDTLKGTVSVVGQEPAPPPDATKEAPGTDKAKAGAAPGAKPPEAKGEAYWREQFATAHRRLDDDAKELDVLQREYNLKEQQYYSDPNKAMREQYTRGDLADTKTKINDKTTAVAQDKQAISDLEDALRQAGGDAAWSR